MLAILRNAARPLVAGGVPNVPHVGDGAAVDDTLLEILGSAPHLLRLRVRSIGSESVWPSAAALGNIDPGGRQ